MLIRFLKFSIVGAIATICQYAALVVLVEFASIDSVAASAMGFVIGAFVGYVLNYRHTFQSTLPHRVALPKYLVTAGIGLALNTAVMFGLVRYLHVYYILSQVGATAVTLIWNFAINSAWSFRPGKEKLVKKVPRPD